MNRLVISSLGGNNYPKPVEINKMNENRPTITIQQSHPEENTQYNVNKIIRKKPKVGIVREYFRDLVDELTSQYEDDF